MAETTFFTSESVTEGHADKIADQIADALLDAYLAGDPESRVPVEVMVTSNYVMVAGEVTSRTQADVEQVTRQVIRDIGYAYEELNFDDLHAQVEVRLRAQSPDIAQGVDVDQPRGKPLGAGDQGIMYGYACEETPELMPLPLMLAHQLAQRLAAVRKEGVLPYLRPDGKTQVTIAYKEGRPWRVEAVVVSAQHTADVERATLRADLTHEVIRRVIPASLLDEGTRYFLNPTGRFVIGGAEPLALAVDTFGSGQVPNGDILATVRKHFDLTPAGMIARFSLRRPIYRVTAAYGHFGRPFDGVSFPWEAVIAL